MASEAQVAFEQERRERKVSEAAVTVMQRRVSTKYLCKDLFVVLPSNALKLNTCTPGCLLTVSDSAPQA